jgi:hypothetical protein
MQRIMPLKRVVIEITNQASENDPMSVKKAIKKWHNALSNGSIPRDLVKKFGRELYLRLDKWEAWISEDEQKHELKRMPGRPRSK